MSRTRMYLFSVLPAALLLFLAARNLSSQPAAKMVGNQACLERHDKQGSKYQASGHGRAGQD